MHEVSGITGTGPIFRAIMDSARAHYADAEPLVSIGVQDKQQAHDSDDLRQVDVCPLSGQLRSPECPQDIQEMIPANVTLPTCEWHRKWLTPPLPHHGTNPSAQSPLGAPECL